ncbi:MAG: DUF1269 domain-containing protein [Thermoleophilia bacterium]|nr:DUF1269 domain-containing protein [Thermoleophilia bacterium]
MAGAALGGLTGSLIGLIGGPAGFVVGGLLGTGAGAATGKAVERDSDEGRAYDEIKQVLEKGSSALVLIAARPTLDEFEAAFTAAAVATAVDQAISDEEAARLAEALQAR